VEKQSVKTLTAEQLNIIRHALANERDRAVSNLIHCKMLCLHAKDNTDKDEYPNKAKNAQLDLDDINILIDIFETIPKVIIKHDTRKA
jgi:hypothetical protein